MSKRLKKRSVKPAPAASAPQSGQWLSERLRWIVWGVIAVGFVIRLAYAINFHLSPDEVLFYFFSHQPSWSDVRAETLTSMHPYPPLYMFVLHALLFFGDSELLVRSLSLVFATAALWLSFVWIRLAFGESAAFLALSVMAFSPALIELGSVNRVYGVLLFAIAGCLYFLERAFRERSAGHMTVAMIFLLVGICTHYSMVWICLTLGLYAGVRIVVLRSLPLRAALAWAAAQTVGAALYWYFFVTHIVMLRGSASEASAMNWFLRDSYYQPVQDSVLFFPVRQTVAFFSHLFASMPAGIAAAAAFVAGVAWLVAGGVRARSAERILQGCLLALPLALGAGTALARLSPYGGTRHAAFLMLFGVTGTSVGLVRLIRARLLPVVLAGVLAGPVWCALEAPRQSYLPGDNQRKELMYATANYLRATVPKNGVIIADHATTILLGYYLDRKVYTPYHSRRYSQIPGVVTFTYDGIRVFSDEAFWSQDPAQFLRTANMVALGLGLRAKDVWAVDFCSPNLATEIPQKYGERLGVLGLRSFGSELAVFQLAGR